MYVFDPHNYVSWYMCIVYRKSTMQMIISYIVHGHHVCHQLFLTASKIRCALCSVSIAWVSVNSICLAFRELLQYGIFHWSYVSYNLTKSITSTLLAKSFWDFRQTRTVSLSDFEQNFNKIEQFRNMSRMFEFSGDFSRCWVFEEYTILY